MCLKQQKKLKLFFQFFFYESSQVVRSVRIELTSHSVSVLNLRYTEGVSWGWLLKLDPSPMFSPLLDLKLSNFHSFHHLFLDFFMDLKHAEDVEMLVLWVGCVHLFPWGFLAKLLKSLSSNRHLTCLSVSQSSVLHREFSSVANSTCILQYHWDLNSLPHHCQWFSLCAFGCST